MEIKAIETEYNGYHFRSRLEARWAVFFDTCGIEYVYEPEGYIGLFGKKYLPDFYFPEYELYGEVKPTDEKLFADQEKIANAIDFEATPISKGLLLFGQIPEPCFNKNTQIQGYMLYHDKGILLSKFLIQPMNEKARILVLSKGAHDCSTAPYIPENTTLKMQSIVIPPCNIVNEALRSARYARFEYNEHF